MDNYKLSQFWGIKLNFMKAKDESITKRLKKSKLIVVIIAVVVAVVFTALIVTDVFVPVKYLSAYIVNAESSTDGELTVSYLDVGYGDCIVVQLPDEKTMLIDGGDGSYKNNLNILKYLNSNKINKIDYLICTSIRSEHCGGLAEILQYKEVEKAYIPYCKNTRITTEYSEFYTTLNQKHIPFEYSAVGLGEGDSESNYFFTFLSPSDKDDPNSEYNEFNSDATKVNINNVSAVLWLQYGNKGFVFTSDAGTATLEKITESYKLCAEIGQPFCALGDFSVKLEDCVFVQVAGHGGDKCTYADWYATLSPEKAVISVGKNYSDCPSLAALSDVTDCNAEVMVTSESGNIVIKYSDENI
jgi:competence protein ComEC